MLAVRYYLMSMKSRLKAFRPVFVGAVLGLLLSFGLTFQPLEPDAKASLIAGLFLTYLSIGILVALVPLRGSRLFFGFLLGVGYSLPGAVFTTVPYPLEATAPAIWSEFAGGGWYTFLMTLAVGAVVGMFCAWFKPLPVSSRAESALSSSPNLPSDDPLVVEIPEEKPERESESLFEAPEKKPMRSSAESEEKPPSKIFQPERRSPYQE